MRLARSVDHLWVAKGKSVTHLNLKQDKPTDKQIIQLMIGPTGRLRAAAGQAPEPVRRGKTLFVGYHAETYAQRLSG